MNVDRAIGRACLLLALGASPTLAQKHAKKGADKVEFTSSCACPSCAGKHRWDVKTDKTPAPATVAADHRITPSELRNWKGPGGKVRNSAPRAGKETEFFVLTGAVRHARLEDDGDIHLQLADAGKGSGAATASIEIPAGEPWCAIRQQVFALLDVTLPVRFSKHKTVSPKGNTVITVTGKAFYDAENDGDDTLANDRGGAGSSRTTVWEIHPVMRLVVKDK